MTRPKPLTESSAEYGRRVTAAVAEVDSLRRQGKKPVVSVVARKHNVAAPTVRNRLVRGGTSREVEMEKRQHLSKLEEMSIRDLVDASVKSNFPIDKASLIAYATLLLQRRLPGSKDLGESWWRSYCGRYPDVKVKSVKRLDQERRWCGGWKEFSQWWNEVHTLPTLVVHMAC